MKKRECHCNEEDCQVCHDYELYTDYMIDVAKEMRYEQKLEQRERNDNNHE